MTDTGPPYPPSPGVGSNGIGLFVIGVSAVGDLPAFDVWKTIISQYTNSPRLTSLITSLWAALDPTLITEEFFDDIFNIVTAVGYGLDVWGRILNVSRVLEVPADTYLGFEEATPTSGTYNNNPFYSGATTTNNFALSDDVYRALLLTRAASLITDGAIPSLNQILLAMFPNRGNAYVVDNGDMSMDITFAFPLTPLDLAVISQSGVFPTPTGVKTNIVQV